ncbi:hypothetical protein [Roseiarcus sp.]|uniref:hypothetical protein n=1 Tax=Roseiarcus sp. TaxID=1969460 RepID=UPI003D0CF1BF
MELRENRTELERLLGGVWDYEDVGDKKTSLPKWLFALTLTGAVVCTLSPSDIVVPVMTALAPAPEKMVIDNVSSANVAEDLDFRMARHTDSPAGWRAFLEAHPDGPHAQAARALIDRPSPEPEPPRAPTQAPDETAQETAALSAPPMMIEEEPAQPPQPVEVVEQSPPSPAATEAPVNAAQSPAPPSPPPVMVEEEPAPPSQPVEVAEQSPPSSAATQAPVEATQSPAAPAVMAEEEPGTTPPPVAVAADAPLPPSRPREIAAAKSAEPARPSHLRAEHRQASEPNVLTILVAQLFHRHGQRLDVMSGGR